MCEKTMNNKYMKHEHNLSRTMTYMELEVTWWEETDNSTQTE